jgi:hypothetical protein
VAFFSPCFASGSPDSSNFAETAASVITAQRCVCPESRNSCNLGATAAFWLPAARSLWLVETQPFSKSEHALFSSEIFFEPLSELSWWPLKLESPFIQVSLHRSGRIIAMPTQPATTASSAQEVFQLWKLWRDNYESQRQDVAARGKALYFKHFHNGELQVPNECGGYWCSLRFLFVGNAAVHRTIPQARRSYS